MGRTARHIKSSHSRAVRSVKRLPTLTPLLEDQSTTYDADRRSDPTPNNTRDRKSGTILAKIPTETARLESSWKSAVRKKWMVETEGTELPTPHPVIEPVSDNRVRNGIFRCRDGGAKTAFSSCGDRYRDERRLEQPTFRGTNARVSGGVRYLWTGW